MNKNIRRPVCLILATVIGAMPLALVACDKTETKEKTQTTTVRETPEGTKKTTETTEKKVETNPK